ncbi:MAG: hypothetical protein J5545_00890 [Bacteroidaceae bacterium]|nr:hypothetical protein [Bacteroidaceae bacterium]
MNKKTYQKPEMQVVNINMSSQLLSGSPLTGTTNNVNMKYGGGSSGEFRSREGWFDDEED